MSLLPVLRPAHQVGPDDRGEHPDAAHEKREDDPLQVPGGEHQRHAQDKARDDGHLVGLEDVRRHAGAVTDVVADKVRDDRRVAGVVFRHARLDLAHEVRADVRRLGVDAATDPHEQREERPAEPEAQQGVGGRHSHVEEDGRAAQKPEAVGQHARDGAGAVRDLQRVGEAGARRGGNADVALHRHAHSELAHEEGEYRSHDEGDCAGKADDEPYLRLRGAGEAQVAASLGATRYTEKNRTTVSTTIKGMIVLSCRPR